MSGLILYSINPRSLGSLPEWLAGLDEAVRLNCNAIHLNPFHPTTNIRKNYHGAEVSGSLYAIRDHFAINPEFCGEADAATARSQLKNFIKMARAKNLRVLVDLVFNHVAADHPLVTARPELFKRNADGRLHVPGPADDRWSDVAAIDYAQPAAWEFFLGTDGYWLRLMDDYLDLGFNGLRCDAVYWLPQLVWEQAINHALRREPDLVVLAETLGLSGQDAALMHDTLRESDARMIYDLCYDDAGRNWDGRKSADLNQARGEKFKEAAYYGTLGFVDSHDFTPRAAELRTKFSDATELRQKLGDDTDMDKKIAAVCLRDYAIACFTNNSVMLPRGYQWCIENNVGPFREQVSAEFFKTIKQQRKTTAHPLTLSTAIAEMHKLRASLPAHVMVRVSDAFETGWKYLSAIQCDFLTHGDERLIGSIILLLNTAAEHGPQKFPAEYWQKLKEGQSNAQRLQFGPDRTHRDDISGVAILVIPGGLDTSMEFNQGRKAKLDANQPEPALVA
jgi:hypothetical protein